MNKKYIALFFILILGVLFFLKREKTEEEVVIEDETEIEIYLDISYSKDCPLCTLDIYKKSDYQEKSVVVFVHGGGWKIGDKSNHTKKGEYFAKQGVVFVSVNYPLYPDVNYKEQVESIAKSIKWIYDNSEEHEVEGDVIVMGHSAGGHLISLLSTDERYMESVGLNMKDIKKVITLDSVGTDIVKIKKETPLLFRAVYKPIFGENEDILKEASPINYINNNTPPFLIIYSNLREISVINANNFYNKITKSGVSGEIYGVDLTHEEINSNIGSEGDEVTKKINYFIKK